MKKIYIIAPLSALVVFAGVYARHRVSSDSAREAEVVREHAAKEASANADKEARRVAVETALKTQRERKVVKDAAEAAEKAALDLRRQALDTRENNRGHRDRLDRRLKSLDREIAEAQAGIERIRKAGEAARAEAAHLRTVCAKAEANERSLNDLLTRLTSTTPAPATGDNS